jgi:hypothetical protein
MYIYIQDKTNPQKSAVLQTTPGQVVGVFYDDAAIGQKTAVQYPGELPEGTTWFTSPQDAFPGQTYIIDFNYENNLFMQPAATAGPPDFAGGKKRRYHGKTKKSRR